jgi:uncharacterized membrane protein YdjX (TVP38/TMEM64 family)
MELKTATALALFGTVLITLVQLAYIMNNFLGINLPYFILNIIYFIGCLLVLIFFATLYSKQNKQE